MRGGGDVARDVLGGAGAEVEGAEESGELTALVGAGRLVADDTVVFPSEVLITEPLLQPAR